MMDKILNDPAFTNALKLVSFFSGKQKGSIKEGIPFQSEYIDFDAIIARELTTRNAKDSPEFRDILIKKIETWKASYILWHEKSDSADSDFLHRVNQFIKYLNSKTNTKRKAPPNTISTFKDLFKPEYQHNIETYVDILRTEFSDELPPLINVKNEWIGNKSAAKAFYDALLLKGVVSKVTNKRLTKPFNQKFKGLGVHFADSNKGYTSIDYKKEFIAALTKL